jgi:hypothetical protein
MGKAEIAKQRLVADEVAIAKIPKRGLVKARPSEGLHLISSLLYYNLILVKYDFRERTKDAADRKVAGMGSI